MEFLAAYIGGVPKIIKYVVLFFVAMIPFTESKGSVVLGAALQMTWWVNWLVSATGLYLIGLKIMLTKRLKSEYLDNLLIKTQTKHPKLDGFIRKNGLSGLTIILSIPFTGIGIWLGAFLTRILKFDKNKSLICLFIADYTCTLITTLCAYGIISGIKMLL